MGATTLLILDVQNGVIDQLENTNSYLYRLASALSAARRNAVNVIHVVTAFRTGYPECHPNNSSVPAVKARGAYQEGDFSVQVHAAVFPASEEPIITKRRVSAFTGTELDMLLRCSNTETLVVAGLITSGAVLSTVRAAMDLDYRITVLRDLCMDRDEEVHRVLMDKVFYRKAEVMSGEEWAALISEPPYS
ncbi:uncharacterized protein N7459_001840 [Penicillium hispanicum]|uniref:uncharacterized protein n=1 Tax=Penicillium hispanicum TaxID=1080232 RepID=UPI002541DEA6|nr:uncharacterized protein N7459_001840 [Penicillium hispanicum]KAJ5591471.1 hypothetical protein N7459_001840 [Penicillium hispanicum]